MRFHGEPKAILKLSSGNLLWFILFLSAGIREERRGGVVRGSGGPFVHCSLMVSLWKAPPVSGRLLKVNYTSVSEHIALL